MSLDEFLKEKQAQEEAKEASKKKDFHDKCLLILAKIKEKSEEKYHELSHLFHTRFSSPNIQRKVIMGFYAQLMNEMHALNPTPVITQTATQLKQGVSTTLANTKKKAQALVEKVEQVKAQAKETKTDKKPAKKEEAKKPAAKAAAKKAPAKKVPAKKASPATAKKKAVKSAGKSVKKKTPAKKK
ncbi:MAG: hypothetical protein A2X86_13205 [Bdellovibrionales bacterium GWA2_49_15]|nr:MAG: hypothetical protein A2X86_13205 [Bdellovibrionales bacterium GWA2_49_15]